MLSEPLLFGAEGLEVAGAEFEAELDDTVEDADEVLLPVEEIDEVAIVILPDIGSAVDVPAETGPAPGVETGIGMITAGPVMDGDAEPIDGVAEPEAGLDGPALAETGGMPAEVAVLQ